MGLDFSTSHTPGVKRDDFVVESGPAGLVLGDELWLEGDLAVAWYFEE